MATVVHDRQTAPAATGLLSRAAHVGDVWPAVAAAGVSLALGVYQLGQPSFWLDESMTARATSFPYSKLIHEHHWIYYTFMKPWTELAGTSEVDLRLPSVLAAAAACALIVPLGNGLVGRPIGSIAGLVLAVNPFVVQWSQQARSYSFVMLAAVGATAALVHFRRKPTGASWVVYTLSLGALLLLQPLSAGLLAAAHFVAAPGFRTRVVLSGLTVVLFASPFLAGVYRRDSESGTLVWNSAPTHHTVIRAILELSGALGVGVILALAGVFLLRSERLLLLAWACVPFGLALALTPLAEIFVPRYLIVSAPAFALLIASAITHLRGPWAIGAIGTFAIGTLAGLLIWYGPNGSQNWIHQDWKTATKAAMRHGGARVEPVWATPAYAYYGGVLADTGFVVVMDSTVHVEHEQPHPP